ncbi:lactate utilization protein [Desulforamulus hydrothermalis]|uniref:LUD domain-containing protein n=1 Tax=Desulforamulus hydrothermalis Lam5 = DSM 18033 TaxID=1121428 RepID=K8EJV9_9FIRM|nr:lactate utilization protein [Desulforamulus hydrothermalis]CCO08841.1 conserved hypothetical protein [Desulforamulus hydrothermalis Lam5 = DSM 18033]SHG72943.1 Uncharacterised ACR, YkgG family COG1556 [Desulforamulus hydrothermalis Lam5 = DSM 18033]
MSIDQWHKDVIGQRVVQALKKNQFDAAYFPTRETAVQHVLSFIAAGAQVGFGGSVTLTKDLNLVELVKAKGAELLVHGDPKLSPEEKMEVMRKQQVCDVFLTGTNAITMDGYLVNIDGVGNRVAALTFGPKKVIVVVGINKICQDVNAAFERLKTIVSPKNNKRLDYTNPCTVTGVCADCQSSTRICRIYSVIKKKPMLSDITVVIIGEELGY